MKQEEMTPQANAMVETYGPAPGLDLSKVKNLDANKVKGNDVEIIQSKSMKAKKAKFCFTEEHEIEIPSRGYLYQDSDDEDIKKGIVRLRPMSLADEEIIANQSYIKNGTVFVHLLNSCILNNFDARDLVSYDVYYLIYALRQITYGEDYEFDITCPECEKKYEFKMQLNEVEFAQMEEPDDSRKDITLPVSGYTVDMRCSKLGDEEEVYKLAKNSDCTDNILGYIVRTYGITDDEGKEVSRKDYEEFFEAIPGKDRAEITKAFKNIDGLKVPSVTCVCPKCGHETESNIPFNKEFFRY